MDLSLIITIVIAVFGSVLIFSGIYFISKKNTGQGTNELTFFGQSIKSQNAGIILVSLGLFAALYTSDKLITNGSEPDNEELVRLAEVSFTNNNFEKALEYFEKVLLDEKDNPEYNSKAGYSAYQIKKYRNSLNFFNHAIQLAPNESNYYFHRSNVYRALNDYDRSLEDINQAIRIAPNNPNLYNNRALIKQSMGFPSVEYCEDFEKAVSLGHKDAKELAKKAGCDIP